MSADVLAMYCEERLGWVPIAETLATSNGKIWEKCMMEGFAVLLSRW